MRKTLAILTLAAAPLLAACHPCQPGLPKASGTTKSPTTTAPMQCDGDPSDPLHCSAAHGETVCDLEPHLCEP